MKIKVAVMFPPNNLAIITVLYIEAKEEMEALRDGFVNFEVNYAPLRTAITTLKSGIIYCGMAFHIACVRSFGILTLEFYQMQESEISLTSHYCAPFYVMRMNR